MKWEAGFGMTEILTKGCRIDNTLAVAGCGVVSKLMAGCGMKNRK